MENICFYIFINGDENIGMFIINQIICVKVNKTIRDRCQFGKFQNEPP